MSSEHDHYRMDLNNWLQSRRNPDLKMEYKTGRSGPHHAPTWEAAVLINGIECGKGTGQNQGIAKEQAAKQALKALEEGAVVV
ncbi:uncharacterized protein FIBRA_00154 [Fibroporia radiculosa]|uniref:DRBM domain-containing protein n=1 Tax=Fibroporia radiculosa TaxID=599839 RepID=J7RV23_9APHY|nr:uncharacterized protein FIBRA_00154 [Fibroporia radiculosa]CCL98160.1 predicted protein [Fibroporia radiculosa]